MSTTFNVFSLGSAASIDPTEGNETSENAGALVGTTFGSTGDPLYDNVASLQPGSTGFANGPLNTVYNTDNTTFDDTFRIDGGPDQIFDAVTVYNATLTYADGTTDTITASVFQDTAGNLYLAPEATSNSDQVKLEAKPITSLRLDSVSNDTTNLTGDLQPGSFVEPDGTIDGTAGNDTIIGGHIDAQGDAIDGFDGDNDSIDSGTGNDTISSGYGDDTISAGSGDDQISSSFGDDSVLGGSGNDSISTGYGTDTVYAGDGDDTVWASRSDFDFVDAGSGSDIINVVSEFGQDTIYGGEGGSDVDTLDFYFFDYTADTITVTFGGNEFGTFTDGTDTAEFYEIEALRLASQNDSIDATSSTGAHTFMSMAGNDTLLGGSGDDTLFGGEGADSLVGNDGSDTFMVEDSFGNDTILGGEGGVDDDLLDLSLMTTGVTITHLPSSGSFVTDGTDTLVYNEIERVVLTDHADSVDMLTEVPVDISGGGGNDTLAGSDYAGGGDTLLGGDGDDVLDGNGGNDTLDGGSGNDSLLAGFGSDTFIGGIGTDTLRIDGTAVENFSFVIDLSTGTDGFGNTYTGIEAIIGGTLADSFTGDTANNYFEGLDGADSLTGGIGADTLVGGADEDRFYVAADNFGADVIIGGETTSSGTDTDWLDFSTGTNEAITVTYSSSEAGTFTDGTHTGTFTEIEALRMDDQADSIDGSNDTSGIYIDSNGGNDTIIAGSGNDTLYLGVGDDSVIAGDGADAIYTEVGNDTVWTGAGNDSVYGWYIDSNLEIHGEAGDDSIFGSGDDTITGGTGNDSLYADSGSDSLDGGSGNDYIEQNDGSATVKGGTGDDTMDLGDDADLVLIEDGFGADSIDAGSGVSTGKDEDTLNFSAMSVAVTVTYSGTEAGSASDGTDTLTFEDVESLILSSQNDSVNNASQAGAIYVDGGSGDDTLTGGSGADTLVGGDGNDLIDGGAGDDLLRTGVGQDTLIGGDGNDTLLNSSGDDSLVGGTGDDLIMATGGNDTLEGGDGSDTLVGGADNDSLEGGAGDDYLLGDGPSAPLLLLNFEDGASTTASDDSGNGFDGSYTSGAGAGGSGWDGSGTSLVLDGSDDYVEIADNPAFQLDDGTISIRFNATTITSGDTLFSRDSSGFDGGGHIKASLNSDGSLEVRMQSSSTTYTASTSSGVVSSGQWHHVAITFGAGGIELWVDGTLRGSDAYTGGISGNTEPWVIGSDQQASSNSVADNLQNFFHGQIDEFAVYDSQLDEANIAILEATGASTSSSGADTLSGGTGADTMFGGDDADVFIIENSFGNDSITGGEGGTDDDLIDLSAVTGPVTVTYSASETGTITDGADTISFSEIERLILTDQADYVDASAVFNGVSGDNPGINVDAAAGDDTIDGSWGGDTLEGGSGADSIDGDYGDDSVSGGAGNDTLIGNTGNDTLFGGDGADSLEGGLEADTLDGGDGGDTLYGGDGADSMIGGLGDDDLQGQSGNDTIDAGDGIDSISAGTGDDSVSGGAGNDILLGDAGNDTLDGGADNDTISAGSGEDSISGGSGNDLIFANSDDDTVLAGAGDDTLSGGTGDDSLTGGSGNDVFTYSVGDGNDTITDFNTGNTGTLNDGDNTNNDFIDLSSFYDDIWELHADQADDGVLNQSNDGVGGVDYSDNTEFGASDSLTFSGANADNSSFTVENTGVVCFTTGTRILTPRGDVLIEDLTVGDLVITADNGPQPIRWINTRHLNHAALRAHTNLRPILINANVLANDRPLLVSPQHCMLLGQNTLVRANHLAEILPGVRVARGKREVTYIHLMFDAHQIIFAENAPSESFYPGPMGLTSMDRDTLDELKNLFPSLEATLIGKASTQKPYGEMARTVLKRSELPSLFGDL